MRMPNQMIPILLTKNHQLYSQRYESYLPNILLLEVELFRSEVLSKYLERYLARTDKSLYWTNGETIPTTILLPDSGIADINIYTICIS